MTSKLYECSKCTRIDNEERLKEHFIRSHVSNDRAPWLCSLCGFKAVSRQHINQHGNHFKHIEAKKKWPKEVVEYIKSESPYRVKSGVDIFEYQQERPNYFPVTVDYHHTSPSKLLHEGLSTRSDRGRKRSRKSEADSHSKKSKTSQDRERSHDRNTSRRTSRRNTRRADHGDHGDVRESTQTRSKGETSTTPVVSTDKKGSQSVASTSSADTSSSKPSNATEVQPHVSVDADTTENPEVIIKEEKSGNSDVGTSGEVVLIEDDEETTLASLEEKISDLVNALGPLQNISKALIALDHHMRNLVPAVEKLVAAGNSNKCT